MSSNRTLKKFVINPTAERPQQNKSGLLTLPLSLLIFGIRHCLDTISEINLIRACSHLYSDFKGIKNYKRPLTLQLLKAIVEDDPYQVFYLLFKYPGLLYINPTEEKITLIANKHTGQFFRADNPFTLAIKLKKLNLLKMLSLFSNPRVIFDNLVASTLLNREQQEGLQQIYTEQYFKPIIEAITSDASIKVSYKRSIKQKYQIAYLEIGKLTDLTIEKFRKILLNDNLNFDCYPDLVPLFTAAFKVIQNKIFKTASQADVFAILIIDFIQSLLPFDFLTKMYHFLSHQKLLFESDFFEKNLVPVPIKADCQKEEKENKVFYQITRHANHGMTFNAACSIEFKKPQFKIFTRQLPVVYQDFVTELNNVSLNLGKRSQAMQAEEAPRPDFAFFSQHFAIRNYNTSYDPKLFTHRDETLKKFAEAFPERVAKI